MRAVGIDMDPNARLDEVRPHWAFGDLQLQRPVGDAIALADLPLLLYAQDVVEIDARDRGEGQAFAGRFNCETRVVVGQVDLADEGVGRLDCGDSGKLEFFHQAILKRLEGALRSASGLGRRPRCARPRAAQGPGRPGSTSCRACGR
jgi:hypothetical protein